MRKDKIVQISPHTMRVEMEGMMQSKNRRRGTHLKQCIIYGISKKKPTKQYELKTARQHNLSLPSNAGI